MDAVRLSGQQPGEVRLAVRQRKLAQVVAIRHENIEGIELHFVVVLARVHAVEIADAVNAEQHRLPVQYE